MNEESSGTKKMFSLYQTLLDVLEKGTVFFADELDIKLHPLLMRNILLTFTDKEKNPNNAQLIFTTHNTIYMDMNLLRRDEIWFVEKDNGVSNLYSLDDITNEKGEKVRKDFHCPFFFYRVFSASVGGFQTANKTKEEYEGYLCYDENS